MCSRVFASIQTVLTTLSRVQKGHCRAGVYYDWRSMKMDVIDLGFIGNTTNPYGYVVNNDLAEYSTIAVPEAVSIWDEIKTIKEQI